VGSSARVQFTDDSPANDHGELTWNLESGEKKEDFPVFEVDGNTIRWIDSPQWTNSVLIGEGRKFVLIYAGTCGYVTHAAILEITFSEAAAPTARVLTEAQFKAAVAGFSFAGPS
jgi:hypothetical protein